MKITALEEYGLRCLLQVAEHSHTGAISASDIAEAEGLSLSYTQKILRVLSKGDLVEARRGANGGYVLTRPSDEMTVGDAIRVLGGVFDTKQICERHTGELDECANRCDCGIRPVWEHISGFVVATLDGISLAMLMNDDSEVSRHLQQKFPVESTVQQRAGISGQ